MLVINKKEHYTTKEASEKLQMTVGTIHQYISRGIIQSVKVRGRRFVPAEEIGRMLTPDENVDKCSS